MNVDWRTSNINHTIPLSGLEYLEGIDQVYIEQTVELTDCDRVMSQSNQDPTNVVGSNGHRGGPTIFMNIAADIVLMNNEDFKGRYKNLKLIEQHTLYGIVLLRLASDVNGFSGDNFHCVLIRAVLAYIESENRYLVKIPQGETLFVAAETSSVLQRQLCGSHRGFQLDIYDQRRQQAFYLNRNLRCNVCLLGCYLQAMSHFSFVRISNEKMLDCFVLKSRRRNNA
uniref:Phospholipid scramblase n=1 Tax=Timema californicum TaxID=61474 RepID=A0A7R9J315_TIMCA|nr:unnamed protein product [Timema californicum]